MSTLIDLANNIYRFGGFDPDNGMMLPFAAYTGSLSFPSRSTGSSTAAWDLATTVATGLDPRATFVSGMGQLTAPGYFTSAWYSFGGSTLIVWQENGPGGFSAKYQVFSAISGGNLIVGGRQYISNHSTVQSATFNFRILLLGFASAT
ncbi:hypothetical protein [Roseibium sediminicola]|uniref:Uncharacterized protein n=1 Tax=Roseibium sediminicola TaxID=2933272 RepID=A0ABT0H0G2_9HYPH|nr:hypothetical protein [Roseibium sp. CAU 1639]MCK7615171.1 hypothetical protein [Roseibium sp. CAU 1639]